MLTTEPGPDVVPNHDRQMVTLRSEDRAAWIYLTALEPGSCNLSQKTRSRSKPIAKTAILPVTPGLSLT